MLSFHSMKGNPPHIVVWWKTKVLYIYTGVSLFTMAFADLEGILLHVFCYLHPDNFA